MAEKKTESIRPGITSSSSHLASMYGSDFFELVWQNGQILVQGGSSSRTLKRPSCIGYSIQPSHEAYDVDPCITKRARLNTLYSLLESSHQNSRQANNDRCSYPFDSKYTGNNSFSNKPGNEFSNLGAERESNSKPNGGNTQLCSSSLQSQKHDLGSDQRLGKINFSNFLRPALFFKSTNQRNSATQHSKGAVLARVEEFKATDGGSSRALDHSIVIDSAKGSHSLNGDHRDQTAFACNKANPATHVDAKKDRETVPDEHSEAIGHDRALTTQGSHGHCRNRTHTVKAKTATEFCGEPLAAAAASLCSLGASNDPNLSRKHEDIDDSTYISDNDEETEDTKKETLAQDGSRGKKRSRSTQMHNLSERKRRDKINKKLRALKELIPNCNKIDKVSMLDDAIDYLKRLKLQLEVLSMGSGGCMPVMMWMLAAAGMRAGIGIPCSLSLPPTAAGMVPQVAAAAAAHAIPNNNTLQMLAAAAAGGFPNNHMLPINPFPMSPSPFNISMPPKPLQPHFPFSHLTNPLDDSDLSPMPSSTQGAK